MNSAREKSFKDRSRQAADGLANYMRASDSEDGVDDENEDYEDYFQTLAIRGPARGVLTVHIKSCRDFKNLSVKKGTQSFLRISVGGKVKCTRLQPYKDPKSNENKVAISFNEWKYFSIRIPKKGERPLDTAVHSSITLELIFFEQDTGVPKLMGKNIVKLLEVLNKDRMTLHLDLKLSRQVICKLDLDLLITYGTFGYGYSHQLKHPKRTMENFVDRSLFLRCPPPMERKDAHYNVLTPRPMPYLDIIGSLLKSETMGPEARESNRIFPPKLMEQLERRGRLLHLHETFDSYDTQADEIQDLEKIILKRGLQMNTSWRQHRKAKKVLSKWRNKASLIPKLLGFVGENKKGGPAQAPTMRAAILAAARNAQRMEAPSEDAEEPQPAAPTMKSALNAQCMEAPSEDAEEPQSAAPTMKSALLAAARNAQRMESPREDSGESASTATTSPLSSPHPLSPSGVLDSPSPEPLFRPGESLFSVDNVAPVSTARRLEGAQQQQQRSDEETMVRGLKSLSLGSEMPLSSSKRDTSLERPPQASRPQGAGGSIWGRLKGTGGTQEQADEVYPSTSALGSLKLPQSHSSAQPVGGPAPVMASPKPDSAPSAPVPIVRPTNPPAPLNEERDPIETWLRSPRSIPSLSSVISEADIEPIRSSLGFSPPLSSQSPQAAGSNSSLAGGRRPKPSRDKLKTQEGTGAPYRRPSHPR